MAYTKKDWVSGETPLSAENMNHMEQGIADAHSDINSLNTKIALKSTTFAVNTGSAIIIPFEFASRCFIFVQTGTSCGIYSAYYSGSTIQLASLVALPTECGSVFVNSGGYLAINCENGYQTMRCMAFYD